MTFLLRGAGRILSLGVPVGPRRLMGVVLAIALAGPAGQAVAGTININFETAPFPSAAQPSDYFSAGAEQTYSVAGVFNISGGVVLGNPTFLPEFAGNGSPPNLYGTADFADPSLLNTITLNLDPSQLITSVTGLLFNGQNLVASGDTESYTVTAYSGATAVDTQNYSLSIDLTSSSSFTTFSLSSTVAAPITQVTFTTPDAGINGWDFLVDSIVAQGPTVPEPSAIVMGGTALLFGLAYGWRRRRAAIAGAGPSLAAAHGG
jgi:hypothetical protein